MHFAPGQLPKVKAFWSITLYDANHNLVANAIDRYAIRDRDPLKFNADGSLDIYIQNEQVTGEQQVDWLPAPKGDFNLVLRSYMPDADIIENEWIPPPVQRI